MMESGGQKSTHLLTCDEVSKTLSSSMTPARVKLITQSKDELSFEVCCQLWTADLLISIMPEYPEGIIQGVKKILPDNVLRSNAPILGVIDGTHISTGDVKGAFNLIEADHDDNFVLTADNWLCLRNYNLHLLFKYKLDEVLKVRGKK